MSKYITVYKLESLPDGYRCLGEVQMLKSRFESKHGSYYKRALIEGRSKLVYTNFELLINKSGDWVKYRYLVTAIRSYIKKEKVKDYITKL